MKPNGMGGWGGRIRTSVWHSCTFIIDKVSVATPLSKRAFFQTDDCTSRNRFNKSQLAFRDPSQSSHQMKPHATNYWSFQSCNEVGLSDGHHAFAAVLIGSITVIRMAHHAITNPLRRIETVKPIRH